MSNNRLWIIVAPLLFLALLLLPTPGFCQDSAKCLSCHSAMKGRIKTASGALVELNIDADKFAASKHGSLSCTDCHLRFADNPHATPSSDVPQAVLELSSKISSKFKIDPVAGAACSTCHEEIYKKLLGSVHGKNISRQASVRRASLPGLSRFPALYNICKRRKLPCGPQTSGRDLRQMSW